MHSQMILSIDGVRRVAAAGVECFDRIQPNPKPNPKEADK